MIARAQRSPRLWGSWHGLRRTLVVRGMLDDRTGRVGAVILAVAVTCALAGPLLASSGPSEIVGLPFEAPSSAHPFGTDALGRDVASRFLNGGATLLAVAFAATAIAYVAGTWVAMIAGYGRGLFDALTVGTTDVLLAFPPILFALILLASLGAGLTTVTLAIAVVQVPRVVRIVRTATTETAAKEFVEAAVARREPFHRIMRYDILPNIWTPILADFGVRLTGSIILFSSLAYLGLGQAPPAADWGLMISENRSGMTIQPWAIVVPAVGIALLAIGVNLVADATARMASISGRRVDELR